MNDTFTWFPAGLINSAAMLTLGDIEDARKEMTRKLKWHHEFGGNWYKMKPGVLPKKNVKLTNREKAHVLLHQEEKRQRVVKLHEFSRVTSAMHDPSFMISLNMDDFSAIQGRLEKCRFI